MKVSNLDEFELPSVRGLKSIALYAETMGLNEVHDYLEKEAGILTDSALSKKGFLVQMAVTTKKESKLKTKEGGGENKGWFKKKQPTEESD